MSDNSQESANQLAPQNPEVTNAAHRSLLHLQVTGNPTPERLQQVVELFAQASRDPAGAVVTTPDDVTIFNVLIPNDQEVPPISVVGAISPELIAELTYEINRTYCKHLGDQSFPNPWATAEEWQKNTNRQGVQAHLRDPSLSAKRSHTSWMQAKLADGWVYGPTKDAEKKTHPALLPYEALSPEVKLKDFLFKTVVDTLRHRIPGPSQFTRAVELYVDATQQWVGIEFTSLESGYVWRFTDAPEHLFQATSAPYLNFGDTQTVWTIDAQPLIQQQAEPDTDGELAAYLVANDENQRMPSHDEVNQQPADDELNEHLAQQVVVDPTEADGFVQGDEL